MWWILAACVSDQVSWRAVDPTEVADLLDAPTATQADFDAFVADLGGTLDDLHDLSTSGTDVTVEIDRVDDAPEDWEPVGTDPTVVAAYLRIACRGPGDSPDPDFRYGSIRIEGPSMLADDTGTVTPHGDLLLVFEACEGGDLRVDGSLPAYWQATERALTMQGIVHVERDGVGVRLPVMADWQGTWRYRVVLRDGRYATVSPSGDRAVVHLADATLDCERTGEWACTP